MSPLVSSVTTPLFTGVVLASRSLSQIATITNGAIMLATRDDTVLPRVPIQPLARSTFHLSRYYCI